MESSDVEVVLVTQVSGVFFRREVLQDIVLAFVDGVGHAIFQERKLRQARSGSWNQAGSTFHQQRHEILCHDWQKLSQRKDLGLIAW